MAENKKLYLVRHAKSSWGYENVSDMDRPLKNRGIKNSYEMSALLEQRGVQPDLILSSPAVRALHTAIIFASQLKFPYSDLHIEELIYFSDEHAILEMVKKTSDAVSSLMLFGHNPIISNLANLFLDQQVEYLPTAAVAELVFETNSWMRINKGNLTSEWNATPKKS
jgi:phosphohistidine phosphatase